MTAISQPYLYESTDYGERWNALDLITKEEWTMGAVNDVIARRETADHLLVAMGRVRASRDGGESWTTVPLKASIRTFARSVRYPGMIYASGRYESARPFFALTTDFGDTWEKRTFEEGPSPTTTHDLAVRESGGQEILFLGTDQGLFSFRFDE